MALFLPFRSVNADLAIGLWVGLSLMLGLALVTGLVRLSKRPGDRGMLTAQVTSWWYLLPPVFAAWALYPVGVWLLVLLMSALAARELAGLSRSRQAGTLRWRLAGLWLLQAAGTAFDLSLVSALVMLGFAGVMLQVWRSSSAASRADGTGRDAVLLTIFSIQAAGLTCLMAMPLASISRDVAAAWFLYLCVVTALNDIGQFVVGTSFGRHKLAARISPQKTWQGVGGGLVISAMVSVWVGRSLGLASVPWLVGMGLVLCVAGLLGDLLFSAGKRALKIKDYGQLIPGHGGILDRVDSLVLTAPVMLVALRWV